MNDAALKSAAIERRPRRRRFGLIAALTVSVAATASLLQASTPAACGNGLLEPGESCETCAADCTPASCAPGPARPRFAVDLQPALGQKPTTATVLVSYRSDRLRLPETGDGTAVRARLVALAPDTTLTPNNLGYALRVVALRNQPFAPGAVYEVQFDACTGAPAAHAADLTCTVEGCASSGTPISGCACAIVAR